jgi:uncharacterized protein (TIGR04222 family)
MDGRPFPQGTGVNQVEVSRKSRIRVVWRFQPAAESTHTFVLTYIARGVVEQGDISDRLAWRALPTEHQYPIASSTVDFELPASAGQSGSRPVPRIEWHRIDGPVASGPRQAEQDTAASSFVIRATAQEIRSNGWIEAAIDLPKNSIVSAPPAWQRTAIEARAQAPRLAMAAALIVGTGLIVLFGLRQRYDAPPRDLTPASPSPVPPDTLPPALAGALLSNGSTGLDHAMGTLFSLASSGVVAIEERSRGMFGQHNFVVRRLKTPSLTTHENTLLALTFDDGKENDGASLPGIRRRLARRFRNFSSAVREDLTAAGLLDPERQRIRGRYFRLGTALLLFGGCSMPVAAIFISRYSGWTFLIPAAFVLVGIASLIFAASTTPLSNEGIRRAAGWRGFRSYLKSISQDREGTSPTNVEALLPFAVAGGLAYGWARFLKRHPGSVPPWFHALSPASQDTAFTAFVTSSAAHGGGAAGAGAGAAGGGASGAG